MHTECTVRFLSNYQNISFMRENTQPTRNAATIWAARAWWRIWLTNLPSTHFWLKFPNSACSFTPQTEEGAWWTPGENIAIPQWVMGLNNQQQNSTKYVRIPQRAGVSFVLKRQFDEIRFQLHCTEESFGDQNEPNCLLEIKTYPMGSRHPVLWFVCLLFYLFCVRAYGKTTGSFQYIETTFLTQPACF